ncbi:hypothetical protein KP79_PYT21469 [Mizuhopecten yessoensis]|uniref:Transmembrane protein n=1 Tax=Mizuhopecten yessoensis TaxID=6573 RepID=A0A210Q7X9_MIZYE|nr:hypothetical protein KP79_PYT21469 [Mizuhopecten yessoensis]
MYVDDNMMAICNGAHYSVQLVVFLTVWFLASTFSVGGVNACPEIDALPIFDKNGSGRPCEGGFLVKMITVLCMWFLYRVWYD